MTKTKSKELDVDFIGGQGPLTREEELAISEYIKSRKLLRDKKSVSKTSVTQKKKIVA